MTKLGLLLAAATITLASVVACSSSDSTTPGGSSGGTSSSSSGDNGTTSSSSSTGGTTTTGSGSTWAQALCAHNDKCDPGLNIGSFGSTAACVTAFDKSEASAKTAPDSGATDAALTACATAIQAADCTKPVELLDVCIFKGKRAAGAGCGVDEQCATGFCLFTSDGDCGKCGAPVAAGGSCQDGPCVAGLTCDQDSGKCVTPAATGASCASVECASESDRCVANKCVAGAAKGAPCTPESDESDDSCGGGLECANNVCSTVQVTANGGQTCGNGVECINGECIDSKCVANLAEGAACDDEASDNGPFCGGTLECIDSKCAYEPTVATCN